MHGVLSAPMNIETTNSTATVELSIESCTTSCTTQAACHCLIEFELQPCLVAAAGY